MAVTNCAGLTANAATLIVTNPVITLTVESGAAFTSAGFALQVSVPAGLTYVMLVSTDLQNWSPIATNEAVADNEIFTDASATNYPSRFYRAVVW